MARRCNQSRFPSKKIDKENVTFIHNVIFFNYIGYYVGKWVDLETIIVSEVIILRKTDLCILSTFIS